MKIIAEYNDGKYKLQVVVNNQSTPTNILIYKWW